MQKTFVLGIGAQKSGTSWLYEYLKQDARFIPGMSKEYHIWDALDIPLLRGRRVVFNDDLDEFSKLRYSMQSDTDKYFDYFDSLMTQSGQIVADITPAYSNLNPDRLRMIRDGFAKRNIDCKVVFLMRDPINRCKSAVKMNLNRSNHREGIAEGETSFKSALREYFKSDDAVLRTNYNVTIDNVQAVFDSSKSYFATFESMFEKPNIKRLSDFLGVNANLEYGSVRVFQGDRNFKDFPRVDREIYQFYKNVYIYCNAFRPETLNVWNDKKAKVTG